MCNRDGSGFVLIHGLWVMMCLECMILHKDNANLIRLKADKQPYKCECLHGFVCKLSGSPRSVGAGIIMEK